MKLLIIEFSPASCYFITIGSKYSPQHAVLGHPQHTFFPQCQRPSFTTTQNYVQNYDVHVLIFGLEEDKKF
jgi:hypothetical protein